MVLRQPLRAASKGGPARDQTPIEAAAPIGGSCAPQILVRCSAILRRTHDLIPDFRCPNWDIGFEISLFQWVPTEKRPYPDTLSALIVIGRAAEGWNR